MKTYELHTFKDQIWKIDSVFDNKEIALQEARRAQSANRYNTIRVVEEHHDEVSNKTATRTVFRADGGNKPTGPRPQTYKMGQRPTQKTGDVGSEPANWQIKRPPAQKVKKSNKIILPLLLVVLLGGALLIGLEVMQQGM